MASWNGSISFGLVYIPISLSLAAGDESIEFHQIHRGCGGRVSLKKVCSVCGKELKTEDIVKGFSYEQGRNVYFEADEIEGMKTKGDRTISIAQFVRLEEIDPVYYEKAYYVEPNGGEKAFGLLLKAMAQENRVGISKVVMGTREYLVALRVVNGTMLLYRLFFASEIRSAPSIPAGEAVDKELEMARVIINNLASPFQPETYHDEFQARLRQAIERKIAGQEIMAEPQPDKPNAVSNLMDALIASVNAQQAAGTQQRVYH